MEALDAQQNFMTTKCFIIFLYILDQKLLSIYGARLCSYDAKIIKMTLNTGNKLFSIKFCTNASQKNRNC